MIDELTEQIRRDEGLSRTQRTHSKMLTADHRPTADTIYKGGGFPRRRRTRRPIMSTYEIIIAVDHPEAGEFATWLEDQGHFAEIGTSTGNYIDGAWTASDDEANEIMNRLWGDYCNN